MQGELKLVLNTFYDIAQNEMKDIDVHIDKLIAKHKSDSKQTTLWTMQAVSLATVVESRSDELENQAIIERLINSITGHNQTIIEKGQQDLAKAQYYSQQMINKLSQQNLISYNLITALNKKLSFMSNDIVSMKNEIESVSDALEATKQELAEVVKALSRFIQEKYRIMISEIEKLKYQQKELSKNQELFYWACTIKYDDFVFEGKGYNDLDEAEKIVCLTNGFHQNTDGNWDVKDLKILKLAMDNVGMSPDSLIKPFEIIIEIDKNHALLAKLFSDVSNLNVLNHEMIIAPILICFSKLNKLSGDEKYILDTLKRQLEGVDPNILKTNLALNFVKQLAKRDLEKQMKAYDFILELAHDLTIFNLLIENHNAETKIEVESSTEKKVDRKRLIHKKFTTNRITPQINAAEKIECSQETQSRVVYKNSGWHDKTETDAFGYYNKKAKKK